MNTLNLSPEQREKIAQSEEVKKAINEYVKKEDSDVKKGVNLAKLAMKLKERRREQLKDEE